MSLPLHHPVQVHTPVDRTPPPRPGARPPAVAA